MKKMDDKGVIEFEHRFTTLSYHVPYLVPDEMTKIDMFIGALGGVYAYKMIAGNGYSSGSSSGAWNKARGRFRRHFRGQLGRQQAGQFGASGSLVLVAVSRVGHLVVRLFFFGHQQSSRCFECGGQDHFRRDCPLLAQRNIPTQPAGQSSARGSSNGTHGNSVAKGGSQQVVVSMDVP
ncbi:hypothetical protein ACLB2K_007296 [Fragaria x ananassa]